MIKYYHKNKVNIIIIYILVNVIYVDIKNNKNMKKKQKHIILYFKKMQMKKDL